MKTNCKYCVGDKICCGKMDRETGYHCTRIAGHDGMHVVCARIHEEFMWEDKPARTPTGIEAQVCADITERQRAGIAKYGTTVADNPLSLREWLQHAYEECLDQAVYLRRSMAELDAKELEAPELEEGN